MTGTTNSTSLQVMRFAVLAAVLAGLALLIPAAASAATIRVTTAQDEFDAGSRCSLREAVWSANNNNIVRAPGCRAGTGADTIIVPSGRYRLTRPTPQPTPPNGTFTDENENVFGDIDVTGPLTITHTGIDSATIDADPVSERALQNFSQLTVRGMTIAASGNRQYGGGGILNQGKLTLQSSLIADNVGTEGAGFANVGGNASLTNVTITENRAADDGGGILVAGGKVKLKSVTISGNSSDSDTDGAGDGAGFFVRGGGVVQLVNTLVAGNFDEGSEAFDCAKLGGTITSQGHNIIGNANGCAYQRRNGDITNQPAQILDLIDNGGPTQTQALKKTSPAINKGASCGGFDQRGVPRGMGGKCDIGAWELARCQGVVINQVGTPSPELLIGTNTADGFLGLGGSDTLRAKDGNDGLCGGPGNDRLEGGAGNDGLDGGPGKDTCLPAPGKDKVVACEVRQ